MDENFINGKWVSFCRFELDTNPSVLFGIMTPYISGTGHLCIGLFLNNKIYSIAIYIHKHKYYGGN